MEPGLATPRGVIQNIGQLDADQPEWMDSCHSDGGRSLGILELLELGRFGGSWGQVEDGFLAREGT